MWYKVVSPTGRIRLYKYKACAMKHANKVLAYHYNVKVYRSIHPLENWELFYERNRSINYAKQKHY